MLLADQGGSGFYRMQEPARIMRERYPDLDIKIGADIDVEAIRYPDGRVEVQQVLVEVDLLVVQRPLSQPISEAISAARRQGIKIVIDLDDDFHNVHPDNIAAKDVDPHQNQWHNRLWLNRAVRLADVITVSTPALLKYACAEGVQRPGVVLRNRVPQRATLIEPNPAVAGVVGWTGTIETHPHDLVRARGCLNQVDAPFAVVGDDTGIAHAIGTTLDRITLAASWTATVPDYWQAMADSFGVGIAPLEPSKFNNAKSALKLAEYQALSIPWVASPTSEYRLMAANSRGGELAASQERWGASVKRVLDNHDKYAQAGHQWAVENTLEGAIHEWAAAWQLAIDAKR